MKFSLHPVRGVAGCCHLLVERESGEAILLDTGLVGEVGRIGRLLKRHGLEFSSLRAIVLTHGHLDHAGNLARIVAISGAPVYAHPAEQAHLDGTYPYRGWARACGAMEAVGRVALRYRPARITHFLEDGMELPFWGGLRVVHLPGHTAGHCGFYSARHDLLFSGDLFASYGFSVHAPPSFLNAEPERLPESFAKVAALNPLRIIPNHYDRPDGLLHRRRFDALYRIWRDPLRAAKRKTEEARKRWKFALFTSSILFGLAALVLLPICLLVAGMAFDDPYTLYPSPARDAAWHAASIIVAIPFVLIGGQGIAWLGFAVNRRLLTALGMAISMLPFLLFFLMEFFPHVL